MTNLLYGYRSGRRDVRKVKISNTAAVVKGDILKEEDVSGVVMYTPAAAGENSPRCVALQSCPQPTADGDQEIEAEFSEDAKFEYPPDAGTVDSTLPGKTCDIGGAQSINIDASADDVVRIVSVNTPRNTLLVTFNFSASPTGVA